MATIYVENQAYEADPKQNLLHACLSLGFDVPYFCWHPALGSVGACRQCAVKQYKDEADTRGKLVMACMTPVTAGTRISISDKDAYEFRSAVIQGLMQNHPHDCPVCDEGGECHLQDMTVMTGHRARTYNFGKRTFKNQYLGPFINHEMNRCIQCQRCVRYYRDYAGGHDLNAFRLRDTVFFGRAEDGTLENEFSGNLVEICPTGVFTDATLKKHYTRKWDLQMAPSVCVHCAVGCNISVGERYGQVRRVANRYNGEVNGYFLCDRGRFGYEFLNSPDRIRGPLVQGEVATKHAALEVAALHLAGGVIGIGSPRASLESNFALRQFVGPENFFSGVSMNEWQAAHAMLRVLRDGTVPVASLHEVELSDAAFIVGEDITNTAPIMALRLRQSVRQKPFAKVEKMGIPLWLDQAVREAVQEERGPLFIASPYATSLDDIATKPWRAAPADIARLAFAVAHEIDNAAPQVHGLPEEASTLASTIAAALLEAARPLVVSGCGLESVAVAEAAAQVAQALKTKGRDVRIAFAMTEANSFGTTLLDAPPLEKAFAKATTGGYRTAVILENDLFRRTSQDAVLRFIEDVEHIVVLDHTSNQTIEHASVVLPAGAFAETDGTLVNSEGRAQRFFQVCAPTSDVQESWRWIKDLAAIAAKPSCDWAALDDIIDAMAHDLPALTRVREAAPARQAAGKIAREPNRYSGRTSMLAQISVHEPKPPEDPDSALAFSMESGPQSPSPSMIPFFWAPGWNSNQATAKFQAEVGGALRGGDPGVRLVEVNADSPIEYSTNIPEAFRPRTHEWLIVPIAHIFGTEELSRHAPGIAQLSPAPYAAMNPRDAEAVGLRESGMLKLQVHGEPLELPVSLRVDLPRGVVGIPAGVVGMNVSSEPVFAGLAEDAHAARSIR